uniref:rRNA N-glycosylase n=1 Tax=Oryza punctata TaxID=4537 RepID=A0A0E0LHW3_ORYPU
MAILANYKKSDNMYLVGFKTHGALCYEFKNKNHMIPGATALDFDNAYCSPIGGGHELLQEIRLRSTGDSGQLQEEQFHP